MTLLQKIKSMFNSLFVKGKKNKTEVSIPGINDIMKHRKPRKKPIFIKKVKEVINPFASLPEESKEQKLKRRKPSAMYRKLEKAVLSKNKNYKIRYPGDGYTLHELNSFLELVKSNGFSVIFNINSETDDNLEFEVIISWD